MPSLLVAVLVDELCQRAPLEEIDTRRAEFEALAEALVAEQDDIPTDIELACQKLVPELVKRAGVPEHTGALYPTNP